MDIDPIHLALFCGYGTPERLMLWGRALRNTPATDAEGASLWRNLAASFNRFESDELRDITVRATLRGEEWETASDEEGYFAFVLEPANLPPTGDGWQEVTVRWVDAANDRSGPPHTASVLTPPPSAVYGVISDIDDTILASYIPAPARMALEMLLKNAYTRTTFEGAPAFYRALRDGPAGATGAAHNPIFYISLSPWNLYGLIEQFLAIQGIPPGPVLLRDYGLHLLRQLGRPSPKVAAIDDVLETYPHLPFILLGDSGQHDPEIYTAVVRDHPGRILAVYIRDVSGGADLDRRAAVQALAAELAAHGVDLLLAPDTAAFAAHAQAKGWVSG